MGLTTRFLDVQEELKTEIDQKNEDEKTGNNK